MDPIKEFLENEKKHKKESFVLLNQLAKKGGTLFVGSSLMEQFPLYELLANRGITKTAYNRGIGGYTTKDMKESMEEMVFGLMPSKIFINIGSNDIGTPEYSLNKLMDNYRDILKQIKERLPAAQVFVMAYYPVNETDKVPDTEWGKHLFETRTNENIANASQAAAKLAQDMGCQFVDANSGLTDAHGKLKQEFTIEGIHLYANAYDVILENLLPYL